MLFVLLAAMAVALFATGLRMRRAEAKLKDYQREYGILDVENPAMLHAVARWTPEPGQWRWQVHFPPGKYEICYATSEIPAHGFPKPGSWSRCDMSGEATFSTVVYKDPLSGRWTARFSVDGSTTSRSLSTCPMQAKMLEVSGVQWNQPPAIISPDKPLILLRERIGKKQKDGSYQCSDLSDGLMIWIQRAGGASGGHP